MFFALLDPTKGSEQAGTRPVVIVSRNAINLNSPVVICVPFTDLANCPRIYPSQVLVRKGVGGLKHDSVALCEQVRAITIARLKTHIGRLDPQTMSTIDDGLKIALNMD